MPKTDLDIAVVAKEVRKAIKVAQKAGSLPARAKFSVTISRYSMGQSLDVTISDLPFMAQKRDWLTNYVTGNSPMFEYQRYTPKALAVRETVERIIKPYHRDNSDLCNDYHNTNFYFDVSFSFKITEGEIEDAKALVEAHAEIVSSIVRAPAVTVYPKPYLVA